MICKVPHCGKKLYPGNRTGVCREHNHAQPYCGCIQCTGRGERPRYRLKTREEMIEEGLLPDESRSTR